MNLVIVRAAVDRIVARSSNYIVATSTRGDPIGDGGAIDLVVRREAVDVKPLIKHFLVRHARAVGEPKRFKHAGAQWVFRIEAV
jgi:hypothetical protein